MADLSDIQAAGVSKIVGSDSSGVEQTPVQSTSNGGLHINLRDNSGTETGTLTNKLNVNSVPSPSVVDSANSSSTPLGISATFTGTFTELLPYTNLSILVQSDQNSAALGLKVEWSANGSTVHADDTFNYIASTGKQYTFGAHAQYYRIQYINGTVAQGSFTLQTILHYVNSKPSSHKVDDAIKADDDAELIKSTITGKASDGNYYNVQVDTQGRLVTSAITGFGADFAFGDIVTSATTLTTVRRTTYTEQTTNGQRSIASSNANDTSAGTGARTLKITYYDQTGAGPFTETLTLNGTARVNTVNSDICFIEQMEVLTAGSTGSNVGIITLFTVPTSGGSAIGTIAATDNQTFWAHHYVGIGKECNITGVSCGHNGTTVGSGALFFIRARTLNSANVIDRQVTDFIRLYGQSSTFARAYTSPVKVLGPARLLLHVTPETSTSTTYRGAFDFFEP